MAVRIITRADLDAIKNKVQSEIHELDAAYLSCLSTLDEATKTTWSQEKATVQAWLDSDHWYSSTSNADLYSQGIGLESLLRQNWYPRFRAAGCTLPNDPTAPTEPALSTANASSPLAMLAEVPPMLMVVGLLLLVRAFK
jgi:hypothetical protein